FRGHPPNWILEAYQTMSDRRQVRLAKQPSVKPGPRSRHVLAGTRGTGRADRSREPVASAEIGADQVTVPAESLAQLGDLYLEVPFRYGDAGPNPVQELVFCH